MKIAQFLYPALFALILSACGTPTLDGSSEESFKASVQKVTDKMAPEEAELFRKSMLLIAMDGKNLFQLAASGPEAMLVSGMAKMDGKTAAEVNAMADLIRVDIAERERKEAAEAEARKRTQALQEIEELRAKMADSESAKAMLEAFEVTKSRFYKEEMNFVGERPVIELSVKNGLSVPVARAYFEGMLATPGRSVPWYQDTFNYKIPGGLESGEGASWELDPGVYSGWASAKTPEDAVFTVRVTRLDGPDGQPIATSQGFGEKDAERLKALLAEYGGEG